MCIMLCWCLDWCLFTWCLGDCLSWCLCIGPKGICLLNSMYGGYVLSVGMRNDPSELPEEVRPIEKFVCSVYSSGGATTTPALRWELFRSRNLESEKLPPTRATLMPHILRTNFVAMRDKRYTTPHPCLLPIEENGWMLAGDEYVPVPCLYKPAPVAVLELIKCSCKTSCKGRCSCKKNNIPCTALCKYHNSDCGNLPTIIKRIWSVH